MIPQTALGCRGSGGVVRGPVVLSGHSGAKCALYVAVDMQSPWLSPSKTDDFFVLLHEI